MYWRIDDSGCLSTKDSQVSVTMDKSGSPNFNAIWIDEVESSVAVWRFNIHQGQGIWIGVGTEDRFATSYRIKGLLFGGPGNLSDGRRLVKVNIETD